MAHDILKSEFIKDQSSNQKLLDPPNNKAQKRKHSSATKAASLARSAVDHVHPHRINGLTSRFTHTGTNIF